jgi:soluble lytic murein transglycosylase-like protein
MLPRFISLYLTVLFLIVSSSIASAQSWYSVRDSSMRLIEQGKADQAYSVVTRTQATGENLFDKEFVAGWIALRNLNRPDVAITHFSKMAMATSSVKGNEKNSAARAKAGYWLGRALKKSGRTEEANRLFKAAVAYPNTFYGQLSASEIKFKIGYDQVKHLASSYPIRKLYWYDTRVRKEFVHAIIREESRFNQNALSNKAARGMMQVLDGTAKGVGKKAGVNIDTNMMRNNADYNIVVGSRYLADQMNKYNNAMLAAAAYNAGPARPDEWIGRFGDPRGGIVDPVDWAESIPFKETREYVQKVIGSYVTYLALESQNK